MPRLTNRLYRLFLIPFRPSGVSMSTTIARPADVQRSWFVVDAADQVLGRLATRIASVLRGKHKPTFTPHVDCGDFVVVVNADKIKLTGRKLDQKHYHRYSGYPGGLQSRSARQVLNTHPERVLQAAVKRMLPKNRLARDMYSKLKVYAGDEHPHAAQKPQPFPDYV
jgi:large subunit ribosomal protein L13